MPKSLLAKAEKANGPVHMLTPKSSHSVSSKSQASKSPVRTKDKSLDEILALNDEQMGKSCKSDNISASDA